MDFSWSISRDKKEAKHLGTSLFSRSGKDRQGVCSGGFQACRTDRFRAVEDRFYLTLGDCIDPGLELRVVFPAIRLDYSEIALPSWSKRCYRKVWILRCHRSAGFRLFRFPGAMGPAWLAEIQKSWPGRTTELGGTYCGPKRAWVVLPSFDMVPSA